MADEEGRSRLPRGTAPACVLVVEDDPLLRRVVVRLLKSWDYEVIEAPDGFQALDRFREGRGRIAAVLLDIMLPGINGVAVAREVRAEDPSLPIVACSAAFNDGVEADLRGAGVRYFLPKPYSSDALRATIDRASVVDGAA